MFLTQVHEMLDLFRMENVKCVINCKGHVTTISSDHAAFVVGGL